ncbi:COP1-interactive protein 1 [Gossypium hirsutum]|uniref:COP1-interactive protein 1 n=1 Tax=Gossypium hirsutum TaxID=3635 RepID=A0A1U8IDR4_GOSHI|nr:COP1-interactive protein 1-like [Gossypium hirsutum]
MRKSRDSMEANKKAFTESNLRLKKENEKLGKKFASYEAEFKKLKDPKEAAKMLEQENGALREKVATGEAEIRKYRLEHENGHLKEKLATCEVELRKSRDSMEAGKNSWTESISRLEHENGELKEKLASCEAELRELRDSMNASKNAMNESNSKLMQENGELGEKLSCEGKLSEEEEKVKLLKAIADLLSRIGEMEKITKEKDEALLGREEEKRKAIRGLCLLIDYHRRFFFLIKLWSSDSKKYSIASDTRLRKESYEKVSESQVTVMPNFY